jgi:Uncharacterized protein conserved in bacteria
VRLKIYFNQAKINEIRTYTNGEKDKKWETWNEAGKKLSEANFVMGKKSGKWFVWDENGTLRYDMEYLNGDKKALGLSMTKRVT